MHLLFYGAAGRNFLIIKQRILLMTKLALYDKNEGKADRAANEFFRHDYIYKKNMATRFFTGTGATILAGLYWIRMIFIDGADIFVMDVEGSIRVSVLFVAAVISVYSVIGVIQGTRQYFLVQKRLRNYAATVYQLERVNERARRRAEQKKAEQAKTEEEGAADLVYGTNNDRERSRR